MLYAILSFLLIVVLVFSLRSVAAIHSTVTGRRFLGNNDARDWLHVINYTREEGIPDTWPNLLPKKPIGYPLFMAFVLSKLDKKYDRLVLKFFGPVVEVLNVLALLLFFAIFVLPHTPVSIPLTSSIILTGAIYGFNPLLFGRFKGSGMMFSPRILGSLFLTTSILPLIAFQVTGQYPLLLLSIASGILILLTHKFTTQLLVAILFSFTFVEGALLYLGVGIIVFALAIILTGGYYLKVLHTHLAVLRYWIVLQFLPTKWHGFFVNNVMVKSFHFGSASGYLKKSFPTSPKALWYNDLTSPFFHNPLLFTPLLIILLEDPTEGTMVGLLVWFIAIVGAHLIISLPGLRFLGGPGRYYEYSGVPLAILCSIYFFRSSWGIFSFRTFLLLGLSYNAVLSIYAAKRSIDFYEEDEESGLKELREWLADKPRSNVLIVPPPLHKYLLPEANHRYVFSRPGDHTSKERREEISRIIEFSNFFRSDLTAIADRHEVRFIVVSKSHLSAHKDHYELPDLEESYENSEFIVFKRLLD